MDIENFINNFDDISTGRKTEYLSDIIGMLILNDSNGDLDARYVLDELLVNLQDLEADDYFGTEGYKG